MGLQICAYDTCEVCIAERLVEGVEVASRYVRKKGWEGHVVLNQEHVPELWSPCLGGHMCVSGSTAYRSCLLDADVQWMGNDRFSLGGAQGSSIRERI